jgi:hypothetical protein
MIPKYKFKSRIRYYGGDQYYCVEYAYYRLFPIYHKVRYWFHIGVINSSVASWSIYLFKEQDFDSVSERFNTIEKVITYKEKEQKRHDEFIANVRLHEQKKSKGIQIT